MQLVSIRIITDDVSAMAHFYGELTGIAPRWATADFAEIVTPAATLALGSTRTVAVFGAGSAQAAANRSAIVEFRVDDVDAEFDRVCRALDPEVVQAPTTMPWGNRSALVRDPDGTLVNLFTPVTADALARQDG